MIKQFIFLLTRCAADSLLKGRAVLGIKTDKWAHYVLKYRLRQWCGW